MPHSQWRCTSSLVFKQARHCILAGEGSQDIVYMEVCPVPLPYGQAGERGPQFQQPCCPPEPLSCNSANISPGHRQPCKDSRSFCRPAGRQYRSGMSRVGRGAEARLRRPRHEAPETPEARRGARPKQTSQLSNFELLFLLLLKSLEQQFLRMDGANSSVDQL